MECGRSNRFILSPMVFVQNWAQKTSLEFELWIQTTSRTATTGKRGVPTWTFKILVFNLGLEHNLIATFRYEKKRELFYKRRLVSMPLPIICDTKRNRIKDSPVKPPKRNDELLEKRKWLALLKLVALIITRVKFFVR